MYDPLYQIFSLYFLVKKAVNCDGQVKISKNVEREHANIFLPIMLTFVLGLRKNGRAVAQR